MRTPKRMPDRPIETEDRYFDQNAQKMMKGDIVRGLVELITNSDDSYNRIKSNSGKIRIDVLRQRKNKPTLVIVRDRAEGMSDHEMSDKIGRRGGIVSGAELGLDVRGFHSRGAKDCMAFGKVTFESIKHDRYYKCELLPPNIFRPYQSIKPGKELRSALHIPRGNGTVVTIEVDPQRFMVPQHQNLHGCLRDYFSLRDIMSNSQRKVILFDLNRKDHNGDPIVYHYPSGDRVFDQKIEIKGYSGTKARLLIYRSITRFEGNKSDPYYQGGFLVKSKRGIHELTFFNSKIKNDPYVEYFFGSLYCDYIDTLMDDYEKRFKKGCNYTAENPMRVLDPDREKLNPEHPFTKALYNAATEHVQLLIEELKAEEKARQVKIENEETTRKLRKLARAASKFLQAKIEEFEEAFANQEQWLDSYFMKSSLAIIPPFCKVVKGETKTFTLRAKSESFSEGEKLKIRTFSNAIKILDSEVVLQKLDQQDGFLGSTFKIVAIESDQIAEIEATCGSNIAKAKVEIVESRPDIPEIENGFSFEKPEYRIIYGKRKKILLLTNFSSVKKKGAVVNVTCDNPEIVLKTPQIRLRYNSEKKCAIGELFVEGRKLGAKGNIKAELYNHTAETKARVVQRIDGGPNLEIKVVPEEFGVQRAIWEDNVLKISGKHKSIKRYLGPEEEKYPGQDSLHFRLLIAEIVAENVASKILERIAEKDKLKFEGYEVSDFYHDHRKYMNEFVAIAHETLITSNEIKQCLSSNDSSSSQSPSTRHSENRLANPLNRQPPLRSTMEDIRVVKGSMER